jgi:Arabinose efflux permease
VSTSTQSRRIPLWLFALFFAAFAIGTDNFVIAGVLRGVSDDLDVSNAVAGQLITAFSLAYVVAAPLMAVALSRRSPRGTMIVATVVFAVVNILASLAPSYPLLLVLRVVAAVLAASVTPAAFATAAILAPKGRQGSYLGIVAAGLTVSLVVGVPIGTWLSGLSSWRATMVFVAALALVAALGMTTLPPRENPPGMRLRARLAPLGRPAILVGLLGTAVSASGGLMFYTYIGPVVRETTGAGPSTLAVLIAAAGLCGVLGTFIGGRAADQWGPERALMTALALQVLAMLVVGVIAAVSTSDSVPVVVIGVLFAIWALAGWALNPPVQVRLLTLAGRAGTEVVALNSSALYVGVSVAGAVGGATLANYGATAVPITAGILGLCAMAVFAVAFQVFRPQPTRPVAGKPDPVDAGSGPA